MAIKTYNTLFQPLQQPKEKHLTQKFTTAVKFLEASDQVYFYATITVLIAVGEEEKKMEKHLLQSETSIKWQNISDMRNVLAHDYTGVDEDIVLK